MRKVSIVLILLMVVGCATMPAPETTKQKIFYAKSTLIGLNNGMTDLVNADIASTGEAKNYLSIAEKADTLLNAAEAAIGVGDEAGALDKWTLANKLLIELNKYLMELEARK